LSNKTFLYRNLRGLIIAYFLKGQGSMLEAIPIDQQHISARFSGKVQAIKNMLKKCHIA